MRIDPSGELWITIVVVALLLFSVYSTSPQLQDAVNNVTPNNNIGELAQDGISIDISISLGVIQIGGAIVVNLEDKYIEFYPHLGACIGCTANIDFGVIDNYENPGDYRVNFFALSGSYWLGIGHSWTPDFSTADFYDENKARAYYFTISPPGVSASYSYYFWDENNQLIVSWGD